MPFASDATVQLVMHATYRVTVPANPGTNLTCSIDADFTISSASFDYTIANPTGSDMRGLKAVVSD